MVKFARKTEMKIGILGGSFDPVHNGHTALARNILDKFKLDKIVFVPANCSPHKKENAPIATAKERVEMLRLATKNNKSFEVSDCEMKRGDISYSIDTILEFEKRYPFARLFWIIGGDAFGKLDTWFEVEEIKERVTFIVAKRNDGIIVVPEKTKTEYLENDIYPFSSSDVKRGIIAGEDISDALNADVLNYINEHKLYRKK